MRYIYWFLPLILALCLAGCAKTDSRFDGNWVDVNGENTLEIKGNKLKISYGQWSDSYRYKVRQEYGRTYLSNVKEDGNFGMMTELEFSEEDGSLFAWDMLLDADGHRYCFVRKENLEEERKIQDLSEDLPKVIESNEIESFALYFYNAGGTYQLEESWKPGDYSWELERNEDGTYQMNFQISTDSSMAPETMEMLVESEFAAGLAKLLEAKNISGHNGYYLKDTQSEFSYGLYVKYVSGERLRIRAEGTPAQECIFDLNALLAYVSDKVVNEGW